VSTVGLGMEVPHRGLGAEPQWGSGAYLATGGFAYTISSGQTHFRDVFIEDILRCTFRLMWSLLPPTPTPPKNSSNLCKSHDSPVSTRYAIGTDGSSVGYRPSKDRGTVW